MATERAVREAHGKTCALESCLKIPILNGCTMYSLVSMHGAVWGHKLLPTFISCTLDPTL